MNIHPSQDIVLVQADKPENESKSGILIHEDWKSVPQKGTVLAVGPFVETVKVGDRVVFMRYGAVGVGGDLRLCKEKHIHGVLDEARA